MEREGKNREAAGRDEPVDQEILAWEFGDKPRRRFRHELMKRLYLKHAVKVHLATMVLCTAALPIPLAIVFFALLASGMDTINAGIVCGISTMPMIVFVLNWSAQIGDREMMDAFGEIIAREKRRTGGWFVGVLDPDKKTLFNQLVDSHDDIGFVFLDPERLVFEGFRYAVAIDRKALVRLTTPLVVQFAPLGCRWLAIHHNTGGRARRFYIESRRENTILKNNKDTRTLLKSIESWLNRGSG